jgi:hypothetical protein
MAETKSNTSSSSSKGMRCTCTNDSLVLIWCISGSAAVVALSADFLNELNASISDYDGGDDDHFYNLVMLIGMALRKGMTSKRSTIQCLIDPDYCCHGEIYSDSMITLMAVLCDPELLKLAALALPNEKLVKLRTYLLEEFDDRMFPEQHSDYIDLFDNYITKKSVDYHPLAMPSYTDFSGCSSKDTGEAATVCVRLCLATYCVGRQRTEFAGFQYGDVYYAGRIAYLLGADSKYTQLRQILRQANNSAELWEIGSQPMDINDYLNNNNDGDDDYYSEYAKTHLKRLERETKKYKARSAHNKKRAEKEEAKLTTTTKKKKPKLDDNAQ